VSLKFKERPKCKH